MLQHATGSASDKGAAIIWATAGIRVLRQKKGPRFHQLWVDGPPNMDELEELIYPLRGWVVSEMPRADEPSTD